MIGDLNKRQIDLMFRTLRTEMLAVLAKAAALDAWLAAQNAAGALTGPGGPYEEAPEDLANGSGMTDRYTQLGKVFTGAEAVPVAMDFDDYGANIPTLWQPPPGISF